MAKRPAVPARLRGSHPRNAAGRFMSRAGANRQIGRIKAAQARHDEQTARVHGQRARRKTEARLTPQQKSQRTREAGRIERAIHERPAAPAPPPAAPERERPITSLRQLQSFGDYFDDPDLYDDFDVETSPDYEETTA